MKAGEMARERLVRPTGEAGGVGKQHGWTAAAEVVECELYSGGGVECDGHGQRPQALASRVNLL